MRRTFRVFKQTQVVGLGLATRMGVAAGGCGDDLDTPDVAPPALRDPAVAGGGAGAATGSASTPLGTLNQPDVFEAGQTGARNLFVVGHQIDWLRDDGGQVELVQARPAGGDPLTVATLPGSPSELAVVGTDLYWTDWNAGVIDRMPLEGGSVTLVRKSANHPGAITAVDKAIYWGEDDGCVRTIATPGDPIRKISCGAGVPLSIQPSDKNVFWASSMGGLFVAPLGGGASEKIATENSFLGPMLFDGTRLYWINGDTGIIRTMRDDVTKIDDVRTLAKELKTPTTMALGRYDLYYAIDGEQQLKRIAKDGTGLTLLAEEVVDPTDLVLLGSRIYWIEDGSGTIMSLRLQ
jgi:hypothetical protein